MSGEISEYVYGECRRCGEVLTETVVGGDQRAAYARLDERAVAHAQQPHADSDVAAARWLAEFLGEDIVNEIVGQA